MGEQKNKKITMDPQCLQCYLQRHLQTAQSLGDDRTAMAFAKELMQQLIAAPDWAASPHFGPGLAKLFTKYYGLDEDRFRQEKLDSNRFVLERMDAVDGRIREQADPVFAGLQFAVMGNYLDFSALQGKVSYEELDGMLDRALEMQLDRESYQSFCRDLEQGRRLLYLTDNAGEIGFDRLLAEAIHRKYPQLEITFCVRGGPANNDATREDAEAVGICFPVIDNGTRVGGTELESVSPECLEALKNADVILAKGMGNTETLLGCGLNVYFAFLIKCKRIADIFHKPMMTPMLVRERA